MSRLPDFSEVFKDAYQALSPGQNLEVYGLWDSAKSAFLSGLRVEQNRDVLVLCSDTPTAERLYSDLKFFGLKELYFFPSWEVLPCEKIDPHIDIVGERLSVLDRLLDCKSMVWIVAPIQAVMHKTIGQKRLQQFTKMIKVGDELSFSQFTKDLNQIGYQREPIVEKRGEFSVRGGIIDVFSVQEDSPLRIEFDGNGISSIRRFNIQSQLSITELY